MLLFLPETPPTSLRSLSCDTRIGPDSGRLVAKRRVEVLVRSSGGIHLVIPVTRINQRDVLPSVREPVDFARRKTRYCLFDLLHPHTAILASIPGFDASI